MNIGIIKKKIIGLGWHHTSSNCIAQDICNSLFYYCLLKFIVKVPELFRLRSDAYIAYMTCRMLKSSLWFDPFSQLSSVANLPCSATYYFSLTIRSNVREIFIEIISLLDLAIDYWIYPENLWSQNRFKIHLITVNIFCYATNMAVTYFDSRSD